MSISNVTDRIVSPSYDATPSLIPSSIVIPASQDSPLPVENPKKEHSKIERSASGRPATPMPKESDEYTSTSKYIPIPGASVARFYTPTTSPTLLPAPQDHPDPAYFMLFEMEDCAKEWPT